jgi:hypothetical protein
LIKKVAPVEPVEPLQNLHKFNKGLERDKTPEEVLGLQLLSYPRNLPHPVTSTRALIANLVTELQNLQRKMLRRLCRDFVSPVMRGHAMSS